MMNLENLSFAEKNLHFKKGNYIFKEREENGGKMYFIDSGWVKICKKAGDGEVILALLEPGNFFGELALLTGNERIASAVAFTDCKLHTMDKETLELNLLNDKQFTMKILETLALRVDETNLNLKRFIEGTSISTKGFNTNG
jgi:CRP-like cAMP-binding protein